MKKSTVFALANWQGKNVVILTKFNILSAVRCEEPTPPPEGAIICIIRTDKGNKKEKIHTVCATRREEERRGG